MSASFDAYHDKESTFTRRDPDLMVQYAKKQGCPKCGYMSGDDWGQCKKDCPIPGSPHLNYETFKTQYIKVIGK